MIETRLKSRYFLLFFFRYFLVSVVILTALATTGFAQEEEKPQAAVSPLASLGEISEVQKKIVFNTLLAGLSRHYDLISQEQFLEAQESAFDELEAQECTEEQCIRKIQELLQVENLFVLEFLREDDDTQLTLTLIDLDKKTIKSDYCIECDTPTLNKRVLGLIAKLVGTPMPPPDEELAEEADSNLIWHVTAITLTLAASWESYNESQRYNELAARNIDLDEEHQTNPSVTERAKIKEEYERNQEEMSQHKQNTQILDVLTLLSLSWEVYLLWPSSGEETEREANSIKNTWKPRVAFAVRDNDLKINLAWRW